MSDEDKLNETNSKPSKSKKLDRKDAIAELWRRGNLSYKLKGKQVELYDDFKNANKKVNVIASSRRFGKSTVLCILATETCLKEPGTIVKYCASTKQQVEEIIRLVMRPILEDCPKSLMPDWKEAKKRYEFPNGSEIQIGATESGHIENLRGGQAKLAIIDEAGFASDLDYAVKNIMIPAVATTKGKVILCSTPNYEDPNHTFNTEYLIPLEEAGQLKKFTIYDSPMLDEEAIRETIEAYGGETDPRFRVEFLCEVIKNAEKLVIGEFTVEKEKDLVKDVEKPPYFDCYVSMDIGFKDLTGILFAYYDYLKSSLVIVDELVLNGSAMTTDYLAEQIRLKESEHFTHPKSKVFIQPTMRIADNNNPVLLNDLFRLHNLGFNATAKDNKLAQINEVKLRIRQDKIIISPRCRTLLYHLKAAKWNKNRDNFERLRDIKDSNLLGGHADLLDALIYLVRNVSTLKNPYPNDYWDLKGQNVFGGVSSSVPKSIEDFMHKIMRIKKK